MKRLTFKYLQQLVAEHNSKPNTALFLAVEPNYEYYLLLEIEGLNSRKLIRQIKRGTTRDIYNAFMQIPKNNVPHGEAPVYLYWIDTTDKLGDQLIELKTSSIDTMELSDIPEDQLIHIGNITTEDGDNMEAAGGDQTNEKALIKYAKDTLKLAIPDKYILHCIY